ncbi:hypothetical protein RND81_10G123300 [Saponaria officinalis]|uniref:Uncharacterized protein n=1 Tax=Saponaria officinalis TaxID=3572 RepID=A0AAW1I184_SAPOF
MFLLLKVFVSNQSFSTITDHFEWSYFRVWLFQFGFDVTSSSLSSCAKDGELLSESGHLCAGADHFEMLCKHMPFHKSCLMLRLVIHLSIIVKNQFFWEVQWSRLVVEVLRFPGCKNA